MRFLPLAVGVLGLVVALGAGRVRAQPANDNCGAALPVTTGSYSVDTNRATADGDPGGCRPSYLLDVWYEYTAASSGVVQFSVPGSLSVTGFEVCGGAPLGCGGALKLNLTAGQHMLIRVAAAQGNVGTLTISAPVAAVPNDECGGAQLVTNHSVTPFDTASASASNAPTPSCHFNGAVGMGGDLWYQYVANGNETAIFGCGLISSDAGLVVYSACDGGELACSPASVPISMSLSAGESVIVRVVNGVSPTSAPSNVTGALLVGSPVNDACSAATRVTSATPTTLFTLLATADSPPSVPAACDPDAPDVWYDYVAPSNGVASFRVTGDNIGGNITLTAFATDGGSGNPCAGSLLGCSGHGASLVALPVAVVAGQRVLIRVSGQAPTTATNQPALVVFDPVPAYPNDDCSGAVAIAPGSTTFFSTLTALDSPGGDLLSCLGSGQTSGRDLWFQYTSPVTGDIDFLATPLQYPYFIIMTIYDSCGGSELACNSGQLGTVPTTLHLAAGQAVRIRVGGLILPGGGNSSGPGSLAVGPACVAHFGTPSGPPLIVDSSGNGNGNGVVDPGESDLHVTFGVKNDGCAAASQVTATLTSLTATASVVTSSAQYPNLAAGDSAASLTPFVISLSPSHPCGTPVSLRLNVVSGSGFFNSVDYSLPTGTSSSSPLSVVPTGFAATPGSSSDCIVLGACGAFAAGARSQYLISAAQLGGLQPGDVITGIGLRLDNGAGTMESAQSWEQYDVTLGQANRTVTTMSLTYADNIQNPILVRSGPLVIPAGSFTGGTGVNPFYKLITFITPYTYQGGALVVDMVTRGASGASASDDVADIVNTDTGYKGLYNGFGFNSSDPTADDFWGVPVMQFYTTHSTCQPPTPASGACCTGTSCTVVGGASACGGGTYAGDTTSCGPAGNPTTCCPANFDGVNGLQVQDIFAFLNAWFAGDPRTDFNHANGIGVQDIFDFLSAWFTGC